MDNLMIDANELDYLKSCRVKIQDIVDVLDEEESKKVPDKEKIQKIKKILKDK